MSQMNKRACREIIECLMQIPRPTRKDVDAVKVNVAGERGLASIVPNSQIIQALKPLERHKLLPLLTRKITRSISGVTIVAVMTKPSSCPHDSPCAYCPGGPAQGIPQSYTGHEPAALRGIQNKYDAYMQVDSRIRQLKAIGHTVDKVELVVMGGTFPSTPLVYQKSFVKDCLDALIGTRTRSLTRAKKLAETSKIRNTGITFETRPDWAGEKHIDQMLLMGVTRVELGVQTVYDEVYRIVERGHTVKDVVEATRALKDAGLKVLYHIMPGLPGSHYKKDLEGFKKIFGNPNFKPDMIKIYPCLVLKGTKAYEWWKTGEYNPYSTAEAAELISEMKKFVPPWTRIMRVQRDIPAGLVEAGVKKSNLRQLVFRRLKQEGSRCRCIRCREVGHRWLRDKVKPNPENVRIFSVREEASEGTDVFVSAEDRVNDVLVGCLRLRIPSEKAHRPEISKKFASIVRELHVYGALVPVGKHLAEAWQHKGYGAILLSQAENISREEYNRRKILVTSGLGIKKYYMRFGYKYDGPYMSKILGE